MTTIIINTEQLVLCLSIWSRLKLLYWGPMFIPSKEHIRHVILYEFLKRSSASATAKSIQKTYGDGVVTERTCRRWFSRFKNGNYNLQDESRVGRPRGLDSDKLKAAVDANPTVTIRELGKDFNVSHTTVHRELIRIGKVSKVGRWVPHEWSLIFPHDNAIHHTAKKTIVSEKPV